MAITRLVSLGLLGARLQVVLGRVVDGEGALDKQLLQRDVLGSAERRDGRARRRETFFVHRTYCE